MTSERRFVGFIVAGKRFGCGQYKQAEEYSRKTGCPIEYYSYKI